MEEPLVRGRYVLEKEGRGGVELYVRLPELLPDEGWIRVIGHIDKVKICTYLITSSTCMYLWVERQFVELINKKAGDYVYLVLYRDYESAE